MIQREITLQVISDLMESNKIVIVYGARQVGKTTMINNILKKVSNNVLMINADERSYLNILSSRDLIQLRNLVEGYEVVFIDEAQRVPEVGISLKLLHDQLENLHIIVTGSSSLDLSARTKEPLTGRTWTHTLYPISIHEWRNYTGANNYETKRNLGEFLLYGMYPEIFSIQNANRRIQYLKEVTTSYLFKDILTLADIKYPDKITDLLKLLSFQIGQLVSVQELSKTLGIHREAVLHYLYLLEQSFVIFSLGGFSRNLRKEVTKMKKYYFYDLGVRNSIIGNFTEIELRPDKGAMWENFMILERLKRVSNIQSHGNFYYWRTYSGSEIDLIEERDGILHGFEMKWSTKMRKAPKSWKETYPESTFRIVTPENFLDTLEGIR